MNLIPNTTRNSARILNENPWLWAIGNSINLNELDLHVRNATEVNMAKTPKELLKLITGSGNHPIEIWVHTGLGDGAVISGVCRLNYTPTEEQLSVARIVNLRIMKVYTILHIVLAVPVDRTHTVHRTYYQMVVLRPKHKCSLDNLLHKICPARLLAI